MKTRIVAGLAALPAEVDALKRQQAETPVNRNTGQAAVKNTGRAAVNHTGRAAAELNAFLQAILFKTFKGEL